MRKNEVQTPEQALAYIVDCTMATVSDLASKKRPPVNELKRQIEIAQKGVNWMKQMGIDFTSTRANDLYPSMSVQEWSEQFKPENRKI